MRVCACVWPDKGEALSARQPTHQPTHNQALCFALFCFILLYSSSFCFVLLYSTLFCCILLVPAQIRANSRSCCVFVCVCMTCAHDVCAWRVYMTCLPDSLHDSLPASRFTSDEPAGVWARAKCVSAAAPGRYFQIKLITNSFQDHPHRDMELMLSSEASESSSSVCCSRSPSVPDEEDTSSLA